MKARARAWLVAVGTMGLVLAAFVPAASAGTAYVADEDGEQVLHYDAAPGESNWVWVVQGAAGYELTEAPHPGGTSQITLGPGCTSPSPHRVSCSAPELVRIELELGDLDDRVRIDSSDLAVVAYGGEGSEEFEDPSSGGAPRTFVGGPDGDSFRAPASSTAAHSFAGGPGTDGADYHLRPGAVQISLDDVANDGAPGEGDNVHSDVETVIGGAGPDTVTGTPADESMIGNGGADTLDGLGGADQLYASFGCDHDVLRGGGGADTFYPGGDNEVYGGPGDDRLLSDYRPCPDGAGDEVFGGEGTDTADFSTVYSPLFVSLDDVAGDGWDGMDNFHSDIENAKANYLGMVLIGNDGPNELTGGAGDDLLLGAGGPDRLVGGDGFDVADYSERSQPVHLSINGAPDDGAPGEHDFIGWDIEDLRGGSGDDTLTGSGDDNVLDGGPGADVMNGGYGLDAVDYFFRTAAVTVDLDSGIGDDGEAGEHDTVAADVEGIFGGMGGDTLVGGWRNGFLIGFEGDDQLRDAGGKDALDAGEGADTVDVTDREADAVVCGEGFDTVAGDSIDESADDCEDITLTPVPPDTPGTPRQPRTPRTPRPRRPVAPVIPIDRAAPVGAASLAKGQRLRALFSRGLALTVNSSEVGSVTAVLTAESSTRRTVKKRGLPAGVVLARAKLEVGADARETLKLRLRSQGRKGLRGLRWAKLKLVVTFSDRAGNARKLTRHLRLRG